jgi:hypothetical protein
MKLKTKLPQKNSHEDFNDGLNFSRKLIFRVFYISTVIAVLGICVFLLYKEYNKSQINGFDIELHKTITPDSKDYANDYWGFKFKYPGTWWPVVAAFIDGDYYFVTDQVNFLAELDDSQAILEVKTYNNWKSLSFEDWLKDQQTNYFPQGKISDQTNLRINDKPAIRYTIALNKPINKTQYWDVLVLSKNNNIKYFFILETSSKGKHDQYLPEFEKIIKSIAYYTGFGQN